MKNTANDNMIKFFRAVSVNEWKKAYAYCQKSWASKYSADDLKKMFYRIKYKYIKTVSEDVISEYIIDYKVLCSTITGQSCHIIRLICESEPYHPDIMGEWGVNPISILRKQ